MDGEGEEIVLNCKTDFYRLIYKQKAHQAEAHHSAGPSG